MTHEKSVELDLTMLVTFCSAIWTYFVLFYVLNPCSSSFLQGFNPLNKMIDKYFKSLNTTLSRQSKDPSVLFQVRLSTPWMTVVEKPQEMREKMKLAKR